MSSEQRKGGQAARLKGPAKERSAARLAAVQALYQMDLTQRDLAEVLAEFVIHRFENDSITAYQGADRTFFRDIVSGTVEKQAEIDKEIADPFGTRLAIITDRQYMRALLRAGIYELIARKDVPARAVINEYVETARDFFSGDEPSVVNGVLDRVARLHRKSEFISKPPKSS